MIHALIVALSFQDITSAGKYALTQAATQCESTSECGGFIVEEGDHFLITAPVSSHIQFGNPAMGDLYGQLADAGFKIVGDWHTHICSIHNKDFANFFSPADVQSNDGLHTIGYMYSRCDHQIRMYIPGYTDKADEEVDFKSGKVIYLTIGNLVGIVDEVQNKNIPHHRIQAAPHPHQVQKAQHQVQSHS